MNSRMPVILSLAVCTFCLVMIASGKNEAQYWSTVTGILGYWMPQPLANTPKRD
ncbi:hypothetical protein Syn7502_00834 [Synechococcus sp. PCC 7502]|uniref:hypothetical protein n=1 Tax=Synechococcus sp. PCC 7502 TaxID=1173263 RepID=UPI00029F83E4|nr:hypothetical protein [Synechococcus sp. PCC 7502]AFY72966.1 hypothetical protein Syn7502_00834 [Synechococcus sp. PCC 7502]